jgi:creatinase
MVHISQMPFGEKSFLPFSNQEMQQRQHNLRAWMEKNSVDVSLLTSYHCIGYYSGWIYCSFGRRYGMVIDDQNATTISAGIDGGQPWRRSFGDNIVYSDWRKDNYYRTLKKLIPSASRIAIEMDHISLEEYNRLKENFPHVSFVDVSKPAMTMRLIKSNEEINLITKGARIADIGGVACSQAIKAGIPEHEIALASTQAMVREIAQSFPFVELMDTWTWFQSGQNTDGAHNPVTNRTVQPGDILSLNCFPMIFGYYTALERTLFCEYASDVHLDIWEKNCHVHRHGLSLIKPGVRCCDIAAELNELYRSWGLLSYRSFGYGHSFGVLSHYYGREAAVELREDVDTVLEPGMVVSMEPMLTIPPHIEGAGGYREHDILVVNENGTTNITGFPFGPEYNIIT